jgi:hypothetical protein
MSCPPPPHPGQLEALACTAAADNMRALASPVICFALTCVPCQVPPSPALKPDRAHQRITVQVHAARTQSWFWTQIQERLSSPRDGQPLFPNRFIDPTLEQASIDLSSAEHPMKSSRPPPFPPLPRSSGGHELWWAPHALQLDGGDQQAFAAQQTLAETGVTDGCTLVLIVRQHEGTLPSC